MIKETDTERVSIFLVDVIHQFFVYLTHPAYLPLMNFCTRRPLPTSAAYTFPFESTETLWRKMNSPA